MKEVSGKTFPVNFRQTFYHQYSGLTPLALARIDELPGKDPGLRFVLASNSPEVSHLSAAVGDETPERLADGTVAVRFAEREGAQQRDVRVQAVRADGSIADERILSISFRPRTDPNTGQEVTVNHQFTLRVAPPLPPMAGFLEDWKFPEPTDEEREFARKQWGARVDAVEGDYPRAKELAKALMEELWPRNGRPSAEMRGLQPFEQYQRMVSGRDKGVCMQFSAIFDCACKSLDIPARRVTLCDAPVTSSRILTLRGVNHTTTEVFDREMNQWILLDLRYYMLGAFLGVEGPLTLAEFVLFLNQPLRRKRLHLLIYDLTDKREKLLPLADCPRNESTCYEGWDRVCTYSRP